MSNSKELQRKIERLKKEIEREVYDRLPRKVGVVAVRHFKQNLEKYFVSFVSYVALCAERRRLNLVRQHSAIISRC